MDPDPQSNRFSSETRDDDAPTPEENVRFLGALAYFLAALTGLLLLITRRDDPFVRFHALQSILATLTFFAGGLILQVLGHLPIIGFLYDFLYVVYSFLLFVYWLFLMFRAFQGERYPIPYLGRIVEKQMID